MRIFFGRYFPTFALLFLALVGCSTSSNKDNGFVQSVAVQYAAAKYLESTGDPSDSAQKIIEIADYALRVLEEGDIVAVPALESHIQEKVNWGTMDPSDRVLAMALIRQVSFRLEEVVGGRDVSEDRMIHVRSVFDNVRQAASFYLEGE